MIHISCIIQFHNNDKLFNTIFKNELYQLIISIQLKPNNQNLAIELCVDVNISVNCKGIHYYTTTILLIS